MCVGVSPVRRFSSKYTEDDGIVAADDFRLIDLAAYDARAPLSRDLATLLISLCWREIGESSSESQSAFLAYLERDRRDKRLDDGMPGRVRKIIDAFREPTLRFVLEKPGNPEQWHRQLKVSLVAQAMLHSAYVSGTPDARRWCARLAGRLTRVLLGPIDLGTVKPVFFDAGDEPGQTGSVAPRVTGRSARGAAAFVDRTGPRSELRAALEDRATSVIVVSGPAGMGKTALVRAVIAELGWTEPDEESFAGTTPRRTGTSECRHWSGTSNHPGRTRRSAPSREHAWRSPWTASTRTAAFGGWS